LETGGQRGALQAGLENQQPLAFLNRTRGSF